MYQKYSNIQNLAHAQASTKSHFFFGKSNYDILRFGTLWVLRFGTL